MSLQRKFAILLGLFGITVAVSLGVALAFGNILERELIWPFRSTTALLDALSHLKRDIGDQTRMLPGPGRDEPGTTPVRAPTTPAPAGDRERYEELSQSAERRLELLIDDPQFPERIGASTARSLKERFESARTLAGEWFVSGEPAVGEAAGDAHFALHELIEKIESKVIGEAVEALDFGDRMRRTHQGVLAGGMVVALLLFALGIMLVRRWINRPVARLRDAAARLAAGDFSHRVPVESADDLGLLSAEINDMARLIARMQGEAVERERLASTGEMVRRLAHGIRNPLSGIRSLAELTARALPADNPAREDQLQIIETVDRFNQWLKDLLSVTSPLAVRPVATAVAPWIRGVIASHAPLARMHSVEIDERLDSCPAEAELDPVHLEHAVAAILTNALQASAPGSRVTLECGHASGARHWTIRISDHGPGIDPSVRERIFRPYFTTKPDGNGIGLAVARQAVHAHKGTIEVETSTEPQNHGTAFVIRIPIG